MPYPGVPEVANLGCDDPSIRAAFNDHRELTLEALGTRYEPKAQVTNLDLQTFGPFAGIPFTVSGFPALLRVTDRDMILVRSDVASGAESVSFTCNGPASDDGCNYAGDFNSDPNEAADPLPTPYTQALLAGLSDGWLLRPGSVAGLTCCQAEDLRNLPSQLTVRIGPGQRCRKRVFGIEIEGSARCGGKPAMPYGLYFP